MSQPSELVVWASDTNFSSGPESGSPTKVDPGAAYEAQGGVPGNAFVAPYWNWVLNNHSLWMQYLQNLDTDVDFLTPDYSWLGAHTFAQTVYVESGILCNSSITANGIVKSNGYAVRGSELEVVGNLTYTDLNGNVIPKNRTVSIPLDIVAGATNPTASFKITPAGLAQAIGGQADGYIYLKLPAGATLTGVVVGATNAGIPVTMTLVSEEVNISTGVVTQVDLTHAGTRDLTTGSGSTFETMTAGTMSHAVDNTKRYRLGLDSGGAGATIHQVLVSFADAGFYGHG